MGKASLSATWDNLAAIEAGKSVPYAVIARQLSSLGVATATVAKALEPNRLLPSRPASIRDPEAVEAIKQAIGLPTDRTDRVSAALTGQSHAVPVDGSLLVMDYFASPGPTVAYCKGGGPWAHGLLSSELLIVENLQLFLHTQGLRGGLHKLTGLDHSGQDVAWGSGNAIANHLNSHFFTQYAELFVLPDPDLGGIKTFLSLVTLTAGINTSVRLVLPTDLGSLLQSYGVLLSDSERAELVKMRGRHVDADQAIGALLQTGRKMEQEVFWHLL